ncbi:B-cell antigen receptor complex-associated protein beta chain [Clarias gariepinus]
MNCMLLGCFLLLFVNLTVTADFQVYQKPRFYGIKVGRRVGFICLAYDLTLKDADVTWYKIEKYDEEKVTNSQMHKINSSTIETSLGEIKDQFILKDVKVSDSGIYYCKIKDILGPGTELQVFRRGKPKRIEQRNYIKDMIILFQGFLLILCVVIPLVWYYRLEQKGEAVYEEPVHDHTYEGLEIEHCGDLYEDLTAFSQTPDADASWQIESPEQE